MKLLHRVLFSALLLPLSVAAQSSPSPMTVEEHFALAAGNTEVGKNDSGGEFAVYMTPEGKRKLRVIGSDGRTTFEDEGQLTIEGGTYCSQWKTMNQGRKVQSIP